MNQSCWWVSFCICFPFTVQVCGSDWPTYRHDAGRTGVITETLVVEDLGVAWCYQSAQPPRTAWTAPAKWDAYANIRGLRAMRDYDRVFHPVAVDNLLFFSSSVDDSVHCLDASSGMERWVFTTDAPVRVAPTYADGRVYFGSDDGHAYCVSASDGKLVWKFRPHVEESLILNNGRFVSHWPCRTGVLVEGDTAYCAFSLFPWRPSYVCALDALNGQADGPGRYVNKIADKTLESALVSTSGRLVFPQGRVPPFVFTARDGYPIGSLPGGGGSFVSLVESGQILHGPGNKTGWVTVSNLESLKEETTHQGGTRMTVTRQRRFLLSDRWLRAMGREDKNVLWEKPLHSSFECIVAGEIILVGCTDQVIAFHAADGRIVWSHSVDGRAYGLAVAAGRLFVSTDAGNVYCFQPGKQIRHTRQTVDSQTQTDVRVSRRVSRKRPVGMLHRWVFRAGMHERAKRRGLPMYTQYVEDEAGNHDAVILGNVLLREIGTTQALVLDGSTNSVRVIDNHTELDLPTKQLTAEAWICVDQPQRWGGIVGAVQDNGSFERGWILGYNDARFSFALAAREGPGRLTYLKSSTDFNPGAWYHVVGTYDGVVQSLYVNGELVATATEQKAGIHYPPQAPVEIGAYHDKDEYFRLNGMLHEVAVYERRLSEAEVAARYEAKRWNFPLPIRLETGPYVRFVSPTEAMVRWRTRELSPTILDFGLDGWQRLSDKNPKHEHEVKLSDLRRDRVYTYVISTSATKSEGVTNRFELDTHFNYAVPRPAPESEPYPPATQTEFYRTTASRILSVTGVTKGICVVLGCSEGQLAYELALQSDLRVVGVDEDANQVEKGRTILRDAGIYGSRVALHSVTSLKSLPFTGHFANLVVSQQLLESDQCGGTSNELFRILRPQGGVACLGWQSAESSTSRVDKLLDWLQEDGVGGELHSDRNGVWVKVTRGALEGAGDWSHQYGWADNSAFGGETLMGAKSVEDMTVQWFGRPGPRVQPDRNGRKPSPLAIHGRLFVQGLRRLIGLDAYNGSILWSLEIPPLERFNIPRDSGNWCADDEHVFVAVRDKCWQVDAETGEIVAFHSVIPGIRKEWSYDWSFLAREGAQLIGSSIKKGAGHTNFWGGGDAGWYDNSSGPVTFKLCSENIFVIDKNTSKHAWNYHRGLIINSTITVASGQIYFVECRHQKVKDTDERRVGLKELWEDQYLVALDLKSGNVVWERELDTVDGIVVFFMAFGGDKLVIVSSADKYYNVYGHSAVDGEVVWNQRFQWPEGKSDHGKAMSRPAIVGNNVYVRPHVLELDTGMLRKEVMPLGGCGTYAATTNSIIFRNNNVTLWDSTGGKLTSWNRLRPGCWLSTIPACGMVLSPEAGGGCSCGNWMETSVGFIPVTHKLQ